MMHNRINNFFLNIINISFILFPLSILLGPFLADFTLSLSSMIFLLYLIYNKRLSYLLNNYFFFFLIFYLYILIISLFSKLPQISLESSLFYIRFGVFVFAIKFIIERDLKILKYFTISLTIVFVLALVYGFIYFFGDFNNILFQATYSRIPLPFTDEFILGSYFARLFPIFFCLYLYFFKDQKIFIIILSIITVCCDVLIYLSGERTAFALISISILLLIFSLKKFRIIRIVTLLVSTFIILSITIFNSTVKDRMIDQTITGIYNNEIENNDIENNDIENDKIILNSENKSFNKTLNANKVDNLGSATLIIENKFNFFSEAHTALARSALKIYLDNNLFFGIGPKLFRIYCKEDMYIGEFGNNSCSTHPHYTYLQLLLETGFIGLIMILALLFLVSFKIAKHIFINQYHDLNIIQIGAYIGLFLTLCPLVPSGSFFNNWLNCIYYLPFVFILYHQKIKHD